MAQRNLPLGRDLSARVDAFLAAHPELGYDDAGELARELVRSWITQQEKRTGQRRATHAGPHLN